MSQELESLKLFVTENIILKDVPPGGPPITIPSPIPDNLSPEEKEKRQKQMTEYIRLSGRYISPHHLKSKWVEKSDLPIILADGKDLIEMCDMPRGKYPNAYAIAHSQIEDKRPLRFFVLNSGMVMINPVIINHTKFPVFTDEGEGCMSYPELAPRQMVPRFNKIIVMYQTLRKDGTGPLYITDPVIEHLSGKISQIVQHEACHCNGYLIYDEKNDPDLCLWLGEGPMGETEVKKLYEKKKL